MVGLRQLERLWKNLFQPEYLILKNGFRGTVAQRSYSQTFRQSKDLKVARQCHESYSKANLMLMLINRTIKYKNQEVMTNLCKSMVRPHLE